MLTALSWAIGIVTVVIVAIVLIIWSILGDMSGN